MLAKVLLNALLGSALLSTSGNACMDADAMKNMDFPSIVDRNNKARSRSLSHGIQNNTKIAIDNVRVFDGLTFGPARTVIIEDGKIGVDPRGAQHIDAEGSFLLPGLIDAHCHPSNTTHLEELTRYGVTTGFSMACFAPEMCTSLQNHPGLADVRTTSAPASAPGSAHGKLTEMVDPTLLIHNASQVPAWMERQLAGKPDYFKLVAEVPGLPQDILNDLTSIAHENGKQVAIHASTYVAFEQAINSQCDHIQHSTLDKRMTEDMACTMKRQGQTLTPTLTMMRNTAANRPEDSYEEAKQTVTIAHKEGVPILAGTDGNTQPGVPAIVYFGISMHDELDNLVEAGMSNLEALRAATALPALHFGFDDRGVIAPGKRADLLLVGGNPLDDVRNARKIQRVWVAGVEYSGPLGDP